MAVVNSKALLPLLLVLLQACFLHRQKTRCCCCCRCRRCCWQIDLQANAEILFFKRSLSVFIGAAGALHGNRVWGNLFLIWNGEVSLALSLFLSLSLSLPTSFFWSHYFILKDATVQSVWLPRGTLGHPLKKINIWTMLLWVSMYGCIKLNGAWNWFQVLLEKVYRYSEMKRRGEVPQRGDDLHPGRFIIVFVSPN